MENHNIKTFMGLAGYSLILVGAFFIDTPIIAILGTLMFLAGLIILMLFYNKIFKKHNRLGMLGILIVCLTLGYVSVEFNQFLVHLSRGDFSGINNTDWVKVGIVAVLVLLSVFFIYRSFGKENIHFKEGSMLGWWLSAALLIPFVLLLYWIAYKTGNWMGG